MRLVTGPERPELVDGSSMIRLLDLTRLAAGWSLVLTTLVIGLAAFRARTVRVYGETGQWGTTTATDGFRHWQGWVFLCVLVTWVILLVIVWSERERWWSLLVPSVGFVLVALNTNVYLRRLLVERAGPRTYEAQVPIKPPSGPILDERGYPLLFQTMTRVYDIRIPDGIEVVVAGSLVAAGLSTLVLLLWALDALLRRSPRKPAAAMAGVS